MCTRTRRATTGRGARQSTTPPPPRTTSSSTARPTPKSCARADNRGCPPGGRPGNSSVRWPLSRPSLCQLYKAVAAIDTSEQSLVKSQWPQGSHTQGKASSAVAREAVHGFFPRGGGALVRRGRLGVRGGLQGAVQPHGGLGSPPLAGEGVGHRLPGRVGVVVDDGLDRRHRPGVDGRQRVEWSGRNRVIVEVATLTPRPVPPSHSTTHQPRIFRPFHPPLLSHLCALREYSFVSFSHHMSGFSRCRELRRTPGATSTRPTPGAARDSDEK